MTNVDEHYNQGNVAMVRPGQCDEGLACARSGARFGAAATSMRFVTVVDKFDLGAGLWELS